MYVNINAFLRSAKFRTLFGASLLLLVALSLPFAEANSEAPSTEWQQFFEGSRGCSVIQTSDGGYALTGANASVSLLIRTDSSGNLLWTKAYQIGEIETFLPYLVQIEDGYALAGTLENKFVLVRVDSEGNVAWEKIYELSGVFSSLRSFIRTSDGGYALVGTYLNQPPSDGQTWWMTWGTFSGIKP